jgi:HK97 family phage major capsid protein
VEVKDVIDALDPKMKEYKEQLKAEVTAIDAKHEARVSEINEEVKRKGQELAKAQEQITELAAKNGKLKAEIASEVTKGYSNVDYLKSQAIELITENFDKIKSETPFNVTKDAAVMTMSNNLTGTSVISYVPNDQMRSIYGPHLYNTFRIIPTATGNVTFPRATSGTGEGSFGDQTEGSAKALVDYDVTMVNTSVPFVAGYARVSRQMQQDLPFLQSYLSMSLIEDWNRRFNVKCLNTIATNSTALSTAETVTAAKMIAGIAQHGNLGLGAADLILTTYAAWSTLLLTKPSDYSIPGGVTIDANGNVRIAGVPVVRHQQVATSRFYVLNTNAFGIAQASGLGIRSTETNEDDFIKNLITYRCEARVELLSFQPTAAVYGTTGTA